ncbi:MAG: ferritin family protein [Candidatus Eisenbacteria bacterium]|nr:ferritin family protein [Candidatus Eisenbacteria bacterium]
MIRDIDFEALTLQDALDLAILIEEEAEERYLEFADQMEAFFTPEAARFFRYMAANEAKHGSELRARRQQRFADAPATIDRDAVWEIEAPAYEKARAFITPRRVLEIALDSEEKAHDFFAKAAPYLKDPEVRKLFEELRLEEIEHQRLVREEIAKQPPDSDTDPEAILDEPYEM